MITDEAKIKVTAGKGGDGAVSFRREKYVPKGGPDGGDGGDGGNIYLLCDNNVHTLTEYARKKDWKAENGENGRAKRQTGKNGEDLVIPVPPGTVVSIDEELLHDFINQGDKILVAKGGRGGWGNVHFATATHQAPREKNSGTPGEEKELKLELKLIADFGLIGLPNAGKSTILSRISNARPKIADYPFTTLEPSLGVANYHGKEFIVADIPGLIEGASQGKGLGVKFLKHVERTKSLVHVLDINSTEPVADYKTVRQELEAWSKKLALKEEIVVLNKADTMLPEESKEIAQKIEKDLKGPVIIISAVSGQGIDELLKELAK